MSRCVEVINNTMEKIIGAFEARCQFGKILQEVVAKGSCFVVEHHGEPVAVVVPVEVYAQWKKARSEFFDKLRDVSERANLSPQEADKLANKAVGEARAHNSGL